MKKGEIWLIEFPDTAGHEQGGTRPALIISQPVTNICILVPFTSNTQALRFPYTLLVKPSQNNGLIVESIALLFQIRAIDRRRIKTKLGELEKDYLGQVEQDLKKLLEI